MSNEYNYEDALQGKLWRNAEKQSGSNAPDYKGALCTVQDIQSVTSGSGRDKKIDWKSIPGEKKLSISAWNNDGELNIKVAKRKLKQQGGSDLPF